MYFTLDLWRKMGASESKSKERSNFLIKADMGNPHFLTKGIVSSDFRVKALKSLIQSNLVIKNSHSIFIFRSNYTQ